MVVLTTAVKVCRLCKQPKPLTDFYPKSHHTECKDCWAKSARNQRLALHCLSFDEKVWLVSEYQKGLCPLCQKSLSVGEAYIDHAHDCMNFGAHKKYRSRDCGCKECIRGALHRRCNSRTLSELEQYPHLQVDTVKIYLMNRPFNIAKRG